MCSDQRTISRESHGQNLRPMARVHYIRKIQFRFRNAKEARDALVISRIILGRCHSVTKDICACSINRGASDGQLEQSHGIAQDDRERLEPELVDETEGKGVIGPRRGQQC